MKNSKTLFLKLVLFNGIPFGLLTVIADYINNEEFDFKKILFLILFFGIGMALFYISILDNEMSTKAINSLSQDEVDDLVKNSKIEKMDFESIAEKIENEWPSKSVKVLNTGDSIIVKSNSMFEVWGNLIIISASQDPGYLDVKPKRPLIYRSLVTNYLNALNIKKILEILDAHKGD